MKREHGFNSNDCIQQEIPVINGLVLCGGQSTRMGRDKSEINYHNKSQRRYLFKMLSAYCKVTFISCNAEQSKYITDEPKIEDAYLNAGPLGGILSAFQHNPNAAWLTVPCDLPFINDETIAYLLNYRNHSKAATAFWNTEAKFPEPLITIWEPRAYAILLNFFKQGYKSPGKILMNNDVELLHAPNASVFKNVNTEEEYLGVINILREINILKVK